jgi:hypothetical protein
MPSLALVHDEVGEVRAAFQVTVGHETAPLASVCPFRQAQRGSTGPQPEQVFEDGYQRSTTWHRPPRQRVL